MENGQKQETVMGRSPLENLISERAVREYFGVSASVLYSWRQKGAPAIRIGRSYWYSEELLVRWVEDTLSTATKRD